MLYSKRCFKQNFPFTKCIVSFVSFFSPQRDSDKAELHQMNLEDDSETLNKDYPTPISSAQLETSCSHSPKKLALKMVFDSGENGDEKMVFTVLAEPDRKSGQALETSVPPLLAGSEPHQWKTLVDFPAPVPMSTCTIEPCRKLRKRSALTSSADVQRDQIQTVEHPYSLTAPEKMPRRAGKISTLSISADVERNYCKKSVRFYPRLHHHQQILRWNVAKWSKVHLLHWSLIQREILIQVHKNGN